MPKIKVSIQCSCGSRTFDIPPAPGKDDVIRCLKCGATGTFGDVAAQAQKQAAEAIRSRAERSAGGSKPN